ncbi:MAG: hypothetical protein JXQ90_23090 [Cyclobacteriaceae bacterium]
MNRDEQAWQELKDVWINSAQSRHINIQIRDLVNELKAKSSEFEKRSINSDLAVLKSSWKKTKGSVSQFEKDAMRRDLNLITRLLKRFLNLFTRSE